MNSKFKGKNCLFSFLMPKPKIDFKYFYLFFLYSLDIVIIVISLEEKKNANVFNLRKVPYLQIKIEQQWK